MNAPSLNVPGDAGPVAPGTLDSTLESARHLAHTIASLPADVPETQHPNYGVVRALAFTIIDMLEEIVEDADSRPVGSEKRLKQGFR